MENEDLPSNLNVMDKEELMGVCASYGIKFNPQKDQDRFSGKARKSSKEILR